MNQHHSASEHPQQEFWQRPFQGREQTQQSSNVGRSHFQSPHELTIAEFIGLVRRRAVRLFTALKYQFHEKTLGFFRPAGRRKLALLGLTAFFLVEFEPSFLTKMGRPIVSYFSSNDRRIYDDYGTASLELAEKPSKKAAPKAKTVGWDAFLGGDGGNAAAPVGALQLREEQAKDYIEKYHKIAEAEMEKFGIPASIGLAQGLVESRAGTSKLARGNNNHFGMKCFSRKCPPGHCTNATDDHHKDFFRKYHSAWESWRAHSELLASGHYSRLKKYGHDYRQWAYGLKALGYATDRTYAEKLIGMIEKYDLHRFDR